MKPHKTIAAIMVLTSSAVTAWVSVDIAYPAILCMLGLLGLSRRFTWNFRPERRVIKSLLMLVLAIFFALHYSYTRPHGWIAHEEAMSLAWQTVARYFLAGMILMLFLGAPRQLPASLGLFYIASTICAGQVLLLNDQFLIFRLLELFAVILVILYAATTEGSLSGGASLDPGRAEEVSTGRSRRRIPRWAACGLILVGAGNVGWIAGSVMYRHIELLDYLPAWFGKQVISMDSSGEDASRIGFTNSGRLSSLASVLEEQDTTAALAIESDEAPGYLRARAFEIYRQSQWHDLSYQEAIFPQQGNLYIANRTSLFRLYPEDAADARSMVIRHELEFGDAAFSPLGTSHVEASFKLVLRDDDDIIYAPRLQRGKRYRVVYSRSKRQVAPESTQLLRSLDLPAALDSGVEALAERVFAGCDTTAEKIEAVVRHFRRNYSYAYDPQIPAGRDKLTYFLLEGSQGYCEYFGSGAAILLRLASVPTRYVTGFLVTEKNERTGAWVARNMDAHAWAEAWDEREGRWVTVEATPQDDRTVAAAAEETDASGDAADITLTQFLHALYEYGLLGALSWLFTFHGGSIAVVSLVVLGAVGVRWKMSRSRQARTPAHRSATASVAALQRMLARMDRKVRSAGLPRRVSETLHAFAARLRTHHAGDRRQDWAGVADWYVAYGDLRYRKAIGDEHIERLGQRAEHLHRSL